MKTLRIIGAAFLVLLGALLIVSWSVADKAVTAIESGEAASNLTEKLLADPDFAQIASERIADRLVQRTEGNFVGRIVAAFEPEIAKAIETVLTSDRVDEAVSKSVDKVEDQLTKELTEPNRPTGPFVVTIDLSDRVNARIAQIPVIGTFIPEVTVPPIEKELIDATTFDQVRQVYSGLKIVAGWGFIVGLLLIVSGFWVAPRSKWYWSQALFGVFFVIFAIGLVTRRLIPKTIASSLPGGEEGGAGTFVGDFLSNNAIKPMTNGLIWLAFFSLVFAVVFALIARFLPGWRKEPVAADAVDGPVDSPTEPAVAAFVASESVPTSVGTVVPAEVAVVEEVVVAEAALETVPDEPVVEQGEPDAVPTDLPEASAGETVVVESPASAPAAAPAAATTAKAKPASTKATPAKPAAAKATPAKPAATKAAPAKATPAAEAPKASATDKPAPTKAAPRTRKPPAKGTDA